MDMHCIRRGTGKPLLLIHGIGGSSRSWHLILDALVEAGRQVIAVDLPGHGATPALRGEVSIRTLADAVTDFLQKQDLMGIDAVGSSMGARLVLELARRGGIVGAVVSLDPGGFWRGWEVPFFYYSVATSVRLVRLLQPIMPTLLGNPIGRTALLAQFSARPWQLPATLVGDEMRTFASSPSFDELLDQLAHGERQQGVPPGTIKQPLVIGWGRQDRVCLPRQATRALAAFPDAHLHWFNDCGHFPQWDAPTQTVRLVLAVINGELLLGGLPAQSTQRTSPRKVFFKLAIGLVLIASVIGLFRRKT
ncbi:alpha/beta fold hydrolase [Adhaeribacter pallidiroseus]|uniref:3-oxoadipate enol-lactonase n=1 Tax=Adhaeribacter pallidiroseus TaxID=2072847 RepID=A0A369Q5F5_9BACT|nr:alpha/beta fold hydrolase [Adhaeribacter pallidiroseus]RDC58691.1 3-oxoadipate enol-lactonase [Adhaeribacter pallidiroseus]RDC58735.1 3-oxoadipate enol-lactonase [Adhaeribacter pallidiroseus]RDC58790.1 3-oxoadipate enol-lactonase [Adhaeribacter pallidiroseus]